ncbi:hypothetical protein NX059_010866 [Plenodomus lindquistii]|nr:hypothetical protein NX059_010866 [Plenodomus lindquistii]
MSDFHNYGHTKRTVQQLLTPDRKGYNAILDSNYLDDIVDALREWSCKRIVLVNSKALDDNTNVIKNLKERLGGYIVASKSSVDTYTPYKAVLEITRLLNEKNADCLISIGNSSYSDATNIGDLEQSTGLGGSVTRRSR